MATKPDNQWTAQEYNDYINKKSKKVKYKNIKVKMDEHTFDSVKEMNYYNELVVRKMNGEILDFELQPKFVLQPKFIKNGKTYREIKYVADFKVFLNNGGVEIIDVKGFKTKEFLLKAKMFEYKYPDLNLILI